MSKTIIDQLMAKGVKMDDLVELEGVIRYYRNNEHRSDYLFVNVEVAQKIESGWLVLVKKQNNQSSCTVFSSDVFISTSEGILCASRTAFCGACWKANLEWSIETISEEEDSFIVEGDPFGKEVLKKDQKFFPVCPLSKEWEEFFI